jgi:hypothetical protein
MANDLYDFTPINPAPVGQAFNQQANMQQTAFQTIESGLKDLQKIPKDIRETEKTNYETIGKRNVDNIINNINAISDVDTFLEQKDTLVPTKESLTEQGFGTVRPFGEQSTEGGIARIQAAVNQKEKDLLAQETSLLKRADTINTRNSQDFYNDDLQRKFADLDIQDNITQQMAYMRGEKSDATDEQEYDFSVTNFRTDFSENEKFKGIRNFEEFAKNLIRKDDVNNELGIKDQQLSASQIAINNKRVAELTQHTSNLAGEAQGKYNVDIRDKNSDNYINKMVQLSMPETNQFIARELEAQDWELDTGAFALDKAVKKLVADGDAATAQNIANDMGTTIHNLLSNPRFLGEAVANARKREIDTVEALKNSPSTQITAVTHPELFASLNANPEMRQKLNVNKRGSNNPRDWIESFTVKDVRQGLNTYQSTLATKQGIAEDFNFGTSKDNIRAVLYTKDVALKEDITSYAADADPDGLIDRIVKAIAVGESPLGEALLDNRTAVNEIRSFEQQISETVDQIAGINQDSSDRMLKIAPKRKK